MILPYPNRMRLALLMAVPARMMVRILPDALLRLIPEAVTAMVRLAPGMPPTPSFVDRPQIFPAVGEERKRVILMTGCAQQVLAPSINEATVRLLTRHGVSVVIPEGSGCCGALVQHLGEVEQARHFARRQIDAWQRVGTSGRLDAIIINTSGCGTSVKDYGYLLSDDPTYAETAAQMADLVQDISSFMNGIGLMPPVRRFAHPIAYHAACSLQHGQKIKDAPKDLLQAAGFTIKEPRDGHLCCGSAGTYNILQPKLAEALGREKRQRLLETGVRLVAAGNIGCLTQIAQDAGLETVHTVELLDWATGGPAPRCVAGVQDVPEKQVLSPV